MKGDRRCTANRENVEECESCVYKFDIDLLLDFKLTAKDGEENRGTVQTFYSGK